MDKKSNMKKAMYEMFGVGGDGSEAASTAPAQVKSASVEVKSAPGAEKKSVDHAPVKTPEARPAASFLAPGTVFEGSFRAKGDIEIAGELKGDVTSEGSVLLRSNLQSNIPAISPRTVPSPSARIPRSRATSRRSLCCAPARSTATSASAATPRWTLTRA